MDGMMGSRWDGASDAYRLVDAPASFFYLRIMRTMRIIKMPQIIDRCRRYL